MKNYNNSHSSLPPVLVTDIYEPNPNTTEVEPVGVQADLRKHTENHPSGGETDLSNYYNKQEIDATIQNIELTPGPKGDPGVQGAQGPKGDPGAKGDTGANGFPSQAEWEALLARVVALEEALANQGGA